MSQTPQQVFATLTKDLPRFDDGRINFTDARTAPVLNAIIYCDGEILIIKRSDKVGAYQGLWNGVSGFIDEPKPIEDFVRQEITEELSIDAAAIDRITITEPYDVVDDVLDRVWVVYPALVTLYGKPEIVLDWEHTDFAWIRPEDLKNYEYVQDFDKSVAKALLQLAHG